MDTIYKSARAHQEIVSWCEQRLGDTALPCRREVWDTQAGDTHLLFAGDDPGERTVVFVPGTNFNAASSLPEIEILSRRHPVVVPDLPGQPGLSAERRARGARVAWWGSWLSEVIDRLERPVVAVGHSLGAAVAMRSTSARIEGRILLSPAGLRRLRTPPALLLSTLGWLTHPRRSTSARLLQSMHPPGRPPSAEHVEWMTLVGRNVRTSLDPGAQPGAALTAAARSPRLVATGRHDVFIPPEHIRAPAREKLDTDVVTLSCGHLLDEAALEYVSDVAANL